MAIDPTIEAAIKEGIHTAKLLMKDLALPEAREFSDIFKGHKIIEASDGSRVIHEWKDNGEYCALMSFCRASRVVTGPEDEPYTFFDVDPRDRVVFEIGRRMITRGGLRINFDIIGRPGGTSLVTAKYDQILGDRWLAIIDSSTIPTAAQAASPARPDSESSSGLLPIIQTLLGLGGAELPLPPPEAGRYASHGADLVGRLVKIAVPTDIKDPDTEHLWISVRGLGTGAGEQRKLIGTVAQKPKHSEGFGLGDKIQFATKEVEDVLSPAGKDRVYPLGGGYSCNSDAVKLVLCWSGHSEWVDHAKQIWESMSEREQDHLIAVGKLLLDRKRTSQ